MHNLTAFPKTELIAWGTFELRTACKHVTWPSLANRVGESRVSVLTMRQYVNMTSNMPCHELHKPPLPVPANVSDSIHYAEHENSKSSTSVMLSFCTTKLLTHTVRHPYATIFLGHSGSLLLRGLHLSTILTHPRLQLQLNNPSI